MKYLIVGYGNIGHKRKAALGKNFIKTFDPNPQVDSDYRKQGIGHKLMKKLMDNYESEKAKAGGGH